MPQFHNNLPLMKLILEEQQKHLQSFISNAKYHPMNPDADVIYQTDNLFSSDKFFICYISDVQHYIRSIHHNTVCTILVKVDVLDTCTPYIWSNDMFALWNSIFAIFYEDRKYCLNIFPKQHALVY